MYRGRQADIENIYAGRADTDTLLTRYGIDYVVIGPAERTLMGSSDQLSERYRSVGATGAYRLLRVARER